MPKRCLITHAYVTNVIELACELDVLTRARFITRRQWVVINDLLRPMLPVGFAIDMRTPKGAVYVVTPAGEYTINTRAKLQKNA